MEREWVIVDVPGSNFEIRKRFSKFNGIRECMEVVIFKGSVRIAQLNMGHLTEDQCEKYALEFISPNQSKGE